MAPQAYADEYELTDELYAEELAKDRSERHFAFIDPDDDEYEWSPLR